MYRADEFDEAAVMTDPVLFDRANQLLWRPANWEFMSILHFRRHPPIPISDWNLEEGPVPRETLKGAVEDWNLWMAIHFNHLFRDAWPRMRAWLSSRPRRDARDDYVHDGLHTRYMVELTFQLFHVAITTGPYETKYMDQGADFRIPGAVITLMEAMDIEFVNSRIKTDTLPHHQFRRPRNASSLIIGCPTRFETNDERRQPLSVPGNPTTPDGRLSMDTALPAQGR